MQPMRWGVRLRASSSKWSSHAATKIDVQSQRGRDSYAVTAPLACEAVARLLKGKSLQALTAPGEIFDGKIPGGTRPYHSMFEIVTN